MRKDKNLTYAQQFQEVFKNLCRTRNPLRAWSDSITMIACAISNSVDEEMFDQREQLYMHTIQKYSKDELNDVAHLFAIIVNALKDDPEQDFLGTLYSTLGLTNKQLGQVFTPYHIAELMARLVHEKYIAIINEKGFAAVADPCCGAGVMLIATANVARKNDVNYQSHMFFYAQDIDFTVAMMCYISLSLLGCTGYVGVGNTLTDPRPSRENLWYMPMNMIQGKLLKKFLSQDDVVIEETCQRKSSP